MLNLVDIYLVIMQIYESSNAFPNPILLHHLTIWESPNGRMKWNVTPIVSPFACMVRMVHTMFLAISNT